MDQQRAENLARIYETLLNCYGPQEWWPAESAFEVVAGAILTQSTAWENAKKAIDNLKKAGCISASAIFDIETNKLVEVIRPSGYFNAKAKKLKSFADWLVNKYNGKMENLSGVNTEALRSELLGIYGIGPETADTILLYGLRRPVFVIDAYTSRIVTRLGLTSEATTQYHEYQRMFTENIETDEHLYNEFHALIVKHAK